MLIESKFYILNKNKATYIIRFQESNCNYATEQLDPKIESLCIVVHKTSLNSRPTIVASACPVNDRDRSKISKPMLICFKNIT